MEEMKKVTLREKKLNRGDLSCFLNAVLFMDV